MDNQERNEFIYDNLDGTPSKFIQSIIHNVKNRLRDCGALDPDDLVQLGWEELLIAADKYEDQGFEFTTYAYIRILGRMRDEIQWELEAPKSDKRVTEHFVQPTDGDPHANWSPQQQVNYYDTKHRLDLFIHNLPERERIILEKHMEGYTQQEIANLDSIDVSQRWISEIIFNLKEKLQDTFDLYF